MPKKILVVDDDPDILTAIKFTLENEGYSVTTTEKGEKAEKLNEKKGDLPDLIILDMLLSGKDGRTICKKLKSQQSTKNIPIMMTSAYPDAEKESLEVGADSFLAKPFDLDVLLSKVGNT